MAAVTYAFSRFKINGSMSACMRTFGEKLLYPLSNSIVIQDVTRRKIPRSAWKLLRHHFRLGTVEDFVKQS